MKRLDDDTIALTQEELDNLRDFIRDSLHREWDHYTDHHLTKTSWEDGMRRMNPEMYDFANQITTI